MVSNPLCMYVCILTAFAKMNTHQSQGTLHTLNNPVYLTWIQGKTIRTSSHPLQIIHSFKHLLYILQNFPYIQVSILTHTNVYILNTDTTTDTAQSSNQLFNHMMCGRVGRYTYWAKKMPTMADCGEYKITACVSNPSAYLKYFN